MTSAQATLVQQLSTIRGGAALHVGNIGAKNLSLTVAGPGALSFPLNGIQAKALIRHAAAAPFGKGRDTIVDESVRKTWEIDAADLKIKGAEWTKELGVFLAETAKGMGIEVAIRAAPYKLLIYEPGGFFAEHQDSEKLPGMFGTLLVGLPSAHEGGELIVNPGRGKKVKVDFSKKDAADFPAVAFIADRKHEIKPVTAGYRVVLVYNLVYAAAPPVPVDMDTATEALADALRNMSATDYQIIGLDHQYTNTNFTEGRLKGNDVARVAALRAAAAKVEMNVRIGLIEEHSICDWTNADDFGEGYYDSAYRRRRKVRSLDKFADLEFDEGIDGHLQMSNWLKDASPNLGVLSLDKEEILTSPDRPADEPYEWGTEGYQGNWGMTVEYTYRHAGVLLWYPAAAGKVLSLLPLDEQLMWADDYVDRLARDPADADARRQLGALVETIGQQLSASIRGEVDFTLLFRILSPFALADDAKSPAFFEVWEPVFYNRFEKLSVENLQFLAGIFGIANTSRLFARAGAEKQRGWWVEPALRFTLLARAAVQFVGSTDGDLQRLGRDQFRLLPTYLAALFPDGKYPVGVLKNCVAVAAAAPDEPWAGVMVKHLFQNVDEKLLETLGGLPLSARISAEVPAPTLSPLAVRLLAFCVEALADTTDLTRPDVTEALTLYRDYFSELAAGRVLGERELSPAVDALLDRLEGELPLAGSDEELAVVFEEVWGGWVDRA